MWQFLLSYGLNIDSSFAPKNNFICKVAVYTKFRQFGKKSLAPALQAPSAPGHAVAVSSPFCQTHYSSRMSVQM